jgi:hypothetical protein
MRTNSPFAIRSIEIARNTNASVAFLVIRQFLSDHRRSAPTSPLSMHILQLTTHGPASAAGCPIHCINDGNNRESRYPIASVLAKAWTISASADSLSRRNGNFY